MVLWFGFVGGKQLCPSSPFLISLFSSLPRHCHNTIRPDVGEDCKSCLCHFPHPHTLKVIILSLLCLIVDKIFHDYGPNSNLIPIIKGQPRSGLHLGQDLQPAGRNKMAAILIFICRVQQKEGLLPLRERPTWGVRSAVGERTMFCVLFYLYGVNRYMQVQL